MILLASFGVLLICLIATFFTLYDWSSCVVNNTNNNGKRKQLNGYYAGNQGVYKRINTKQKWFLDFFSLYEAKIENNPNSVIIYDNDNQKWLITRIKNNKTIPIYESITTTDASSSVPPSSSWNDVSTTPPSPSSLTIIARGNLQPVSKREPSNIEKLFERPITNIILFFLSYIAYYIWAYRIDQGLLTFSYAAFIDNKEWWRVITASVSHFDLMHLGFNAMGVYQIDMESIYNSVKYLYLSINLIIITILIVTGIFYILITRYNQQQFIYAQSVGYSCVLFAWLVASSVRMNEFCPLGR